MLEKNKIHFFKCYENSQSMVRRASIICLVSMSASIGLDKLKPHLNPSTVYFYLEFFKDFFLKLKLVEVYAARLTKRESYWWLYIDWYYFNLAKWQIFSPFHFILFCAEYACSKTANLLGFEFGKSIYRLVLILSISIDFLRIKNILQF